MAGQCAGARAGVSTHHVALVLAAGGSTRLGQPKQLLTREGEPLVHRAVRLARDSGASQVFAVLGAQAGLVADALADAPCEILVNMQWEQGLASSLRHAAPRVAPDAAPVLILGCDQPALEAAHLVELVQRARAAPCGCAATTYGGDPGIPAVVPAAWFAAMRDVVGDRGFRARLAALGGTLARVPAPHGLALDIDAADDLRKARSLGLVDRA